MGIHPGLMQSMKPRIDKSMKVGNEGGGVIVDAGKNAKNFSKNFEWPKIIEKYKKIFK